jgi:hypothetical protein
MKKIVFILVVFLISFNVFATSFYSGNDLKRKVNSTELIDYGFSFGYISAVSDSINKKKVFGYPVCLPDDVELKQLVDVVKIYMNSHPNLLHYAANSLVAEALTDAFPCSQKNSK